MLETQEFHFLLLPEFSVMGFASAVEPLRVANRFKPDAYRWNILSLDGGPVRASNGMSLNVDAALASAQGVQTLLVVAGFNPLQAYQNTLGDALRRLVLGDHDRSAERAGEPLLEITDRRRLLRRGRGGARGMDAGRRPATAGGRPRARAAGIRARPNCARTNAGIAPQHAPLGRAASYRDAA